MFGKKIMNFIRRNIDKIYNIGAAVVILGALFKIEHIVIGPLNGGLMLTVGLIAEALVFTLSAFEKNDDSVALGVQAETEEETVGGISNKTAGGSSLDVALNADILEKLSANFKNLNNASEALSDSVQINTIIKQYNDQMTAAVSHFSALNNETEKHLKASSDNANINADIVEKSKDVQEQLSALNSNLKALNQVYQGMLLAMEKK
ncbi:gliding motility protein GldL [Polaribacter pacificus]|uniref:Gliding motility protein GldL n=1 Tax=Polaribacter pacificus TaxID=1775173 RepID=A0A917MBT7_9FLAO|nr:hypothetical protein [Polaribacter pacificus]GGG90444.1 gliding motility protein GldL [Polaribacter pacificus]